jgi:hypothetical protein
MQKQHQIRTVLSDREHQYQSSALIQFLPAQQVKTPIGLSVKFATESGKRVS